ncbi:MAG: hypothetical protein CMN96_00150 [Synechococcus sp. MED850]|nr:hypothetical protein [Synechococcus sp. MED850]OUW99478.1 MAG: hypothetical protein CBD89_00150 [Cyanobacteria bacterium TMED229]
MGGEERQLDNHQPVSRMVQGVLIEMTQSRCERWSSRDEEKVQQGLASKSARLGLDQHTW